MTKAKLEKKIDEYSRQGLIPPQYKLIVDGNSLDCYGIQVKKDKHNNESTSYKKIDNIASGSNIALMEALKGYGYGVRLAFTHTEPLIKSHERLTQYLKVVKLKMQEAGVEMPDMPQAKELEN